MVINRRRFQLLKCITATMSVADKRFFFFWDEQIFIYCLCLNLTTNKSSVSDSFLFSVRMFRLFIVLLCFQRVSQRKYNGFALMGSIHMCRPFAQSDYRVTFSSLLCMATNALKAETARKMRYISNERP